MKGPLPEGHPAVGANDDSAAGLPVLPQDDIHADDHVPAGEIHARIVDENDRAIAGVPVTLGILRTSVAQGEQRTRTVKGADADGRVRFDSLQKGSGWSYRLTVTATGADPSVVANYSTSPFQLPLDTGFSVVLHRFPVSSNLDGLMAAIEGVDTIVEVRDDVVEVQQTFEVIDATTTSWGLGHGLTFALPAGFKGLRTGEVMDDYAIAPVEGVGVRWTGSFPPGQTRLTYDFKLPYDGEPSIDIPIELPPRVLAARVRVPARKGMGLKVDGFPDPKLVSIGGVSLLSTIRRGSPQDQIRSLRIIVAGLPTPGPTRYFAILGGLVIAAGGGIFALRTPREITRAKSPVRQRQRREILDELVALERARRASTVGPRFYEAERQRLVDRVADTLDDAAK